ncbi:G-protein coupled receptor 35 [Acanthochromis polyacanthus]|uniref:G-protein coupled receptor 35 n=1 Tax=Acanthochromis polyacanthus TaxID=80966 RepID=UPI00223405C9|nr:G-protein coupled receptor 35 [Acanthochromis polyacanthus]XP_051809582.1 G-protein coupled receptor 35 [Acanthochromis polyacanthus]XP_051809583.1 G-protein coupled receptor 35 [Acanthochromis polyacanthus]XP_051809584.1 G-protein coupled receptor 35 [Acanthochromis polyacanthus]
MKSNMSIGTTNASCPSVDSSIILTNICNTTNNYRCEEDILQGVGYSSVFLLGFVVNAAALWAFIAKRKAWTETHIYMLNLVLADSALVLFLPFRIYDAFICMPVCVFCTFLIYTHFINMYASIWTTAAISVHRYLAVRFPLKARSWRKKKEMAFVACLVIWVLLITVGAVFWRDNHPENLWMCYERCKNIPLHAQFLVLLEVLGFLLPLLIVMFCSSRIICILSRDKDKSEEKKRSVSLVTANMIVFIVCYTPIHVAFIVNYFNVVPENWTKLRIPQHTFLLVSEWIASTNCCFDSVSYYFLLERVYSVSQRKPQNSCI